VKDLAIFAADAGVEMLAGEELAAMCTGNFREDPSIDYGRYMRRVPHAVLRPRDRAALAGCMRFLFAAGIRFKTRGAGHSSGGQALLDDGVVIDLRHLSRVVSDDGDTITVEGGMWWLALVEHLHAQGRRPRSITANLRSCVAGTLSVGGFGDSSHLWGLQINHVERMTLITPDGAVHALGRDDELFRYSLAGRGLLGVIADVTLQTMRRPWTMMGRMMRWASLADFLRDHQIIVEHELYDFLRARLRFVNGRFEVVAHLGRTSANPVLEDPGGAALRPADATPPELIDLHRLLAAERPEDPMVACPAVEFVLPLPLPALWDDLAQHIAAAGIPALQPDGHSVMVVARDDRLPLAPLPAATSVMVALRPKLPAPDARALIPALRAIGRRALELGARMYLMSIEIEEPHFLERQFGEHLVRLRELKAAVDPRGLLNAGLL